MTAKKPGWQSPALPPRKLTPMECPHIGAVFAAFTISSHAEGHEWVCPCGQVFMVVSNAGKDKRLVKTHKGQKP